MSALSWFCLIAAAALLIIFTTAGYNASPSYYWATATAVVPIAAFVLLRRAVRRGLARRLVVERWARPPLREEPAAYKSSRSYFHSLSLPEGRTVDDRTWDDLAMDSILSEIDVCYSSAGSNELYALLRDCLPPQREFETRQRLAERLRDDEEFRMRLLEEIAVLDNTPGHDPAAILHEESLIEDRLFPLYLFLAIAAVALLFSPILVGLRIGLMAILGIFILNMWVYHRKSRNVSALVPPLRGLFRILRQGDRISRLDFADTGFDSAALRDAVSRTSRLSRSFRSVITGSAAGTASAGADIVETLTVYLKTMFLIDLIAYCRLVKGIKRFIEPLREIYRTVGYLDAVHAAASFLEWVGELASPHFEETVLLQTEGLYHPLIEDAIANSISLSKPGAVITGTNMAGKSTFLRTLGINAILAQTIGGCFASTYRGGRFLVMSSIEKGDQLSNGKSFYYTEAERIFRMIESLEDGTPVLLLIDELLSGTNSLEREGASIAILDYLARRNALTVAATHDVTIARKLQDSYSVHYFTDRATADGLSFDYLIRPGIVKTRNAIKLLSLIGYPQELIDSAIRSTGGDDREAGGSPAT